jgi:hypothetical protein
MARRKAKKAEQQEKAKKRKKRHPLRKLLFLGIVGGAIALVLSEDVRNKALDALFGSEEEFQYSPPAAQSGDGDGAASA